MTSRTKAAITVILAVLMLLAIILFIGYVTPKTSTNPRQACLAAGGGNNCPPSDIA